MVLQVIHICFTVYTVSWLHVLLIKEIININKNAETQKGNQRWYSNEDYFAHSLTSLTLCLFGH